MSDMPKNKYEQAELAALFAREHKLDADTGNHLFGYRLGKKWFQDPVSFTVALIVACDKVGIPVPENIRQRTPDLD